MDNPAKSHPSSLERDPVIDMSTAKRSTHRPRVMPRIPYTFAIVFVQAVLLFILYVSLIQEYNANLAMQNWLGIHKWIGNLIFSYNALLVLTVLLVIVVIESFPGRTLAR
jgi:hypothetical protein